ncbi:hypothetical protein QQ045_010747 [Rhodiola kirilowii]
MISQRRGRLLSTGRLSSIDVGNTHKNDFSARRTTTPTVKPCLRKNGAQFRGSSLDRRDLSSSLPFKISDSLHQLLRMSREDKVVGPFVVSLYYSFEKKRRTLTHEPDCTLTHELKKRRSVSKSLY